MCMNLNQAHVPKAGRYGGTLTQRTSCDVPERFKLSCSVSFRSEASEAPQL